MTRDDNQGSFDFDATLPRKPPRWAPVPIDERPTRPVIVHGTDTADDHIQERFLQFHRDNPHIYASLVKLAREARKTGRKRYAIELLFGRLRWQMEVEIRSDEPFKLNDHYTSRYARLMMELEPDLVDMFEIRVLARSRNTGQATAANEA